MEKISTPRRALIPVTANLSTVLVLMLSVWWSGAQRPSVDVRVASAGNQALSVPAAAKRSGDTAAATPSLRWPAADALRDSTATAMPVAYPAKAGLR